MSPQSYKRSSNKFLEKEVASHSSILAYRIPWTEESGRLQSVGSQRVGHNLVTKQEILPNLCLRRRYCLYFPTLFAIQTFLKSYSGTKAIIRSVAMSQRSTFHQNTVLSFKKKFYSLFHYDYYHFYWMQVENSEFLISSKKSKVKKLIEEDISQLLDESED